MNEIQIQFKYLARQSVVSVVSKWCEIYWALLRKHVYALQCYIKKYLNDNISLMHELTETLEEALQ